MVVTKSLAQTGGTLYSRTKIDSKLLWGIGAGLFFGLLFGLLPVEASSPFIIFVVGLFLGLLWVGHYDATEKTQLMTLFLGAYLSRAFFSLLFYLLSFTYQDAAHVGFLFLNDGWAYHEDAFRMVKMRQFGFDPLAYGTSIWSSGKPIFPVPYEHWNSYVYAVTGKSPMAMFMLNSLFGALTVLVLYDLVRYIFDKKAALRAAMIYAYWPSLILWSTQNLKDPMTIFFFTLMISSLLILFRRPSVLRIASLGVATIALYHLQKFYIMVSVSMALLVYFVTLKIHKHFWMRVLWAFILFACVAIVASQLITKTFSLATLTKWQNTFIRDLMSEHEIFFQSNFESLNALRQVRATGGSAFLSRLDISSPLSLLFSAPLLFLFVCFGPFPWQVTSFFKIFGVAEMLVFYSFMPAFLRGVQDVFRNETRTALLLLSVTFIMMMSIALLDANLGTAFRHRSGILAFVFTFIAVGWEKR